MAGDYIKSEHITLFYGKTNPEFSNFFIAPFTVTYERTGKIETFNSVEHYFMTSKARLFDPGGEAIKQMGNDKTPAQMKKLGRQVKNFDDARWSYEGRIAMYTAAYAKFSQNPLLKSKLLGTGYDILAEASPWDKKWGIGLGISSDNAYDTSKWGNNGLGLILMGIRGELRYGKIDFDTVSYHDTYETWDFFKNPDWSEWEAWHQENPKKFELDNYMSISAQAAGEQYFGSPW